MALMQVKVMFFCHDFGARFAGLYDLSNAVPCKCWKPIVHRIFVPTVGCQYRSFFEIKISDVNIDAAAAAASSNIFRHIMPDDARCPSNFGSQ